MPIDTILHTWEYRHQNPWSLVDAPGIRFLGKAFLESIGFTPYSDLYDGRYGKFGISTRRLQIPDFVELSEVVCASVPLHAKLHQELTV